MQERKQLLRHFVWAEVVGCLKCSCLCSYLVSKLAILEKSELVLPDQAVSVNVAEVNLKAQRVCVVSKSFIHRLPLVPDSNPTVA